MILQSMERGCIFLRRRKGSFMDLVLTNQALFSRDRKFPLRGFFYEQSDMPPHKQEFSEVIFIIRGSALHYSEPFGWEKTAAGDVWIVPPGGIHGYQKTENLLIFNLLFIADQLPVPLLELYTHPEYRRLFSRDSGYWTAAGHYPRLILTKTQQEEFRSLLNLFDVFQKRNTAGRNMMKYGLFTTIISRLCDIASEGEVVSCPGNPLDISRITNFLNENYASEIGLPDLLKVTAMSESTLRRHFRKAFGMGPAEYIRNFRLNIAAGLLLNTTYSIKEIFQMSGFSHFSHFCKMFRQVYRCSPGEYRDRAERKS